MSQDDQSASSTPTAPTNPSSGLGLRLGILLGVFLIGIAGVYGFYAYLDSQIPKGDPDHMRESAGGDSGESAGGGMPVSPRLQLPEGQRNEPKTSDDDGEKAAGDDATGEGESEEDKPETENSESSDEDSGDGQ